MSGWNYTRDDFSDAIVADEERERRHDSTFTPSTRFVRTLDPSDLAFASFKQSLKSERRKSPPAAEENMRSVVGADAPLRFTVTRSSMIYPSPTAGMGTPIAQGQVLFGNNDALVNGRRRVSFTPGASDYYISGDSIAVLLDINKGAAPAPGGGAGGFMVTDQPSTAATAGAVRDTSPFTFTRVPTGAPIDPYTPRVPWAPPVEEAGRPWWHYALAIVGGAIVVGGGIYLATRRRSPTSRFMLAGARR